MIEHNKNIYGDWTSVRIGRISFPATPLVITSRVIGDDALKQTQINSITEPTNAIEMFLSLGRSRTHSSSGSNSSIQV